MERSTVGKMKSSKTMRELAKALAISRGLVTPRKGKDGGYVGYALPLTKLKELYIREGFPVATKTGSKILSKHLDMWERSHGAARWGEMVFFALDPDSWQETEARAAILDYMNENASMDLVNISERLNSEALA